MEERRDPEAPLDRSLVDRFLRRRDEEAFLLLYRRHAVVLRRVAQRLVGSSNGDADDVVQATWVRAIENLPRFRWESSLRTWLTGIALNCSREVLKKRDRYVSPAGAGEGEERPAPRAHRVIDRIDLERAIAALPPRYREVLVLHDVEGYTHEEVGGLLGIETGTSKSQLSRARRAMRAKLAAGNGHVDA